MKMKTIPGFLMVLGFAAIALPAAGHHSAAQFDFSQTVSIEGTVKVMEVRNPHVRLILNVEGEDGSLREIEYEGHSRNNIYRRGWRPDMVAVGDTVTIGIAPMRDGSDGGYVTSFKTRDGAEF